MTQRDRKILGAYLRDIANRMHLRDWTVVLEHEPADPGFDGHCICLNSQREAHISIGSHFHRLSAHEQRETIVHELLHVHHETCWRMVQNDLADALGKPTYYVYCDSYRRAMEYQIDALAKTIAPSMPLIDWAKR